MINEKFKISKYAETKKPVVSRWIMFSKIRKYLKDNVPDIERNTEDVINWFIFHKVQIDIKQYFTLMERGELLSEYHKQTKKIKHSFL